ncbi:hypothetical protein COO60DRAFT_1501787 [Scenedesmus sp. NREL 46B-D3]|nr:hypothetical protein COO60DRAFT_1501787 [Scenedesmus sp. NREL 46B-D3]
MSLPGWFLIGSCCLVLWSTSRWRSLVSLAYLVCKVQRVAMFRRHSTACIQGRKLCKRIFFYALMRFEWLLGSR